MNSFWKTNPHQSLPNSVTPAISGTPEGVLRAHHQILQQIIKGEPLAKILDDLSQLIDQQSIEISTDLASIAIKCHQMNQLLQEHEEYLHLAFNVPQLGLWECNLNTGQVTWSATVEKLFGLAPGKFGGNHASFLACVHPDDREFVYQASKQAVLQKTDYNIEFRIVQPNGTIRWIASKGWVLVGDTGKPTRMTGVNLDITDRKQVQSFLSHQRNASRQMQPVLSLKNKEREGVPDARQQPLDTLEIPCLDPNNVLLGLMSIYPGIQELNELKSRFVSTISHEFRTPLTTIQSSAELLEYYDWTPEQRRDRFQQIHIAVKHMIQLLEDVLLIGEADAGKLQLALKQLDLTEFCRNLIADVQLTVSHPYQLVFVNSDIPQEVWLDPTLLRQILNNLLSNAIKYSPQGGTIEVTLTCDAQRIVLSVHDDGIGIPLEDQNRVFETFYRGANVDTIQGAGLGLAIVKKCVELHNGQITLESEIGMGTLFKVVLPLNHPFGKERYVENFSD